MKGDKDWVLVSVFEEENDWIARCVDEDMLPSRTEVQAWAYKDEGETRLDAILNLRESLIALGLIYGSEEFVIEERTSE